MPPTAVFALVVYVTLRTADASSCARQGGGGYCTGCPRGFRGWPSRERLEGHELGGGAMRLDAGCSAPTGLAAAGAIYWEAFTRLATISASGVADAGFTACSPLAAAWHALQNHLAIKTPALLSVMTRRCCLLEPAIAAILRPLGLSFRAPVRLEWQPIALEPSL